jgi:hypothetical protein
VNKMNSKRSKIVYKFLLKSHRYFTLDTLSVQTVLPRGPVEKSKLNLTLPIEVQYGHQVLLILLVGN